MPRLTVFDPALCCATGVCGTTVDPTLARFAGDLKWLESRGVEVVRHNLAQEPGAFAASPVVGEALRAHGIACLPLLVVDGAVATSGAYPGRAKLAEIAGVRTTDTPERPTTSVEFLFLDDVTCARCAETGRVLDAAMDDVRRALAAAGRDVALRRVRVTTAAQALAEGLVSSPTVRVDGRDVSPAPAENRCDDCCSASGADVLCRTWEFRGESHDVPPKEMLVDLVLRGVYAPSGEKAHPACSLPANLLAYFRGLRRRATSLPMARSGGPTTGGRP